MNSLVPIVQDDQGYVQVAAGTYGKGKFLVFPWIEDYLDPMPSNCILDWKFKGVAYQGCANPDSDTGDWCATSLDADGSYVSGLGHWKYCSGSKYQYPDGRKVLSNAFRWMTQTDDLKSKKIASYPETLNPSDLPKIQRIEPLQLSDVDVFITGKFGSWSVEDVALIEKYLAQGGNIIMGSADKFTQGSKISRKPMRDFLIKLGLFHEDYTNVARSVDTSIMPTKDDVFVETVKSILFHGKVPSEVNTKVGQYMKEKLSYIYPESLIESWVYKEIFVPGFANSLSVNPRVLDEHLPEYGSFFQSFLPYMLQDVAPDFPFPNITLPTKHPLQLQHPHKHKRLLLSPIQEFQPLQNVSLAVSTLIRQENGFPPGYMQNKGSW